MKDRRMDIYENMLDIIGATDSPELRGMLGAPEGTLKLLSNLISSNMIKNPSGRMVVDRPDNHIIVIVTHEGVMLDVYDDNDELVGMRCRLWDEFYEDD